MSVMVGCDLDVTLRDVAGILNKRIKIETTQVTAVGGKNPDLLGLLDGPWGSDPAFFIIRNRFRQLSALSCLSSR